MALSNVRLCFVQDTVREYLFCLVGCFLRSIEDFEDMLLESMQKIFGFRKYRVTYTFLSCLSHCATRQLYNRGPYLNSKLSKWSQHAEAFPGRRMYILQVRRDPWMIRMILATPSELLVRVWLRRYHKHGKAFNKTLDSFRMRAIISEAIESIQDFNQNVGA
jgi:hypothetical protein